MSYQDLKNSIESRVQVRDNTAILDSFDQLQIDKIESGILIAWVTWSGPGIINSLNAINYLYGSDYTGQIFIIDIDSINPDLQIDTFGTVLHGWGEIFIIKKGQIAKAFQGKDSSANFIAYLDQSEPVV